MQSRYGICYKDAAHRLFMAEFERVKKADAARNNFGALAQQIEDIVLRDLINPLAAIDDGEFDDVLDEKLERQQKD